MQAVWAAALLVGALLALAPSSAFAHAGHSHTRSTVAAHHVQASKTENGARSLTTTQSLSAPVLPATPPAAPDCDGQGCCTSGPCTGCHGFVLTTTAFTLPSLFSTLLISPEALPPGGADIGRLRRPPKSFA